MRMATILSGLGAGGAHVGQGLVAVALCLLGADMIASMDTDGQIVARTIIDWWNIFVAPVSPDDLAANFSPEGAEGALLWLLNVPAWIYPGLTGVLMAFIFGSKRN